MFFWKLINNYPTRLPLVYVCSHNGVTGVVRAEDFDTEILRKRAEFNRRSGHPDHGYPYNKAVRPYVETVFLFSDRPRQVNTWQVGNLSDMENLFKGCAIEERSFELPAISKSRGWAVLKKNEYAWSLEDVHRYIHGH